ncbi:MAG: F0F1 ATP synthase subunit B [Nibricoccus sp.]
MLTLTPVLAEAAHETAAQSGGGFTEVLNGLGITLPNLLAQIVNFAVVAFLLYKFAWKPVLATLAERQNKIESGLKYAEDMKAQLASAQQENAALLKAAQAEATKVIEEARKTAKDFSDKIQKEATDRANDQMAKAQQAIELEHKKMLADARGEIARLVVSTTERVLAKKLSEADRAGFNEAAAKELTNV